MSHRNLRQWWSAITIVIAVAVLVEAAFAGAMLSGVEWARIAHRANAALLVASSLAAGFVCVLTLRHVAHGWTLGLTLLSLALVLFLQGAVGALSAKSADLLWVHVPLGAALFGLAALAVADARRLPRE